MADLAGLPAENKPEVGKVLPQFNITPNLLEQATQYVTGSVAQFDSQRDAQPEQGTNRKSWRDRLSQIQNAYEVKLESDRTYKGWNDKAAPIIQDNCEAIISRLKEAILPTGDDDLVELDIEGNVDPQLKDYRQKQINWQLEKVNIEQKVETLLRTVVKYGTAYIKAPWQNEQHQVITQQLVTINEQIPIIDDANQQILDTNGQPQFYLETRRELQVKPQIDRKYFGPGYEVVDDIERVYVDMFIQNIEDQPIVIHEMLVSYDHLAQGIERGLYLPDQVAKIKDMNTNDAHASRIGTFNSNRKEDTFGQSAFGNSTKGAPRLYKMHQAFANFEIEGENRVKQCYKVVISVIGNTCIQLMPNPYFHQSAPLIKVTYRDVEGMAMGIGAVDPVLGLYQLYNDVMNQISDGNILCLNPIKIVTAGTITDKQDYKIQPGATYFVRQQGDVQFAAMTFDMASGQQYLELLEQRINRGMGITPLIQGAGDATDLDKTWRGTNKIISQADKKFKSIAKNIEDSAIRQWAEIAYKLNCQFDPMLNATGDEFQTINGEIAFQVKGVDNFFEKQEKIVNYSNFIAQFASVPGFNVPALVDEIASMQDIEIDEQKWGPLYTPPQPPAPPINPTNTSVTMPIDMSKGPTMLFTAAQILKQRGIDINIDSIAAATKVFVEDFSTEGKMQSGLMPSGYDAYRKGDPRTVEKPKGKFNA